jgi:hypothetical protein
MDVEVAATAPAPEEQATPAVLDAAVAAAVEAAKEAVEKAVVVSI